MKSKASSGAGTATPNKKSLGPVSHALLACSLLAACQQSESPAPSAASEPDVPAAASSEYIPRKSAGPGRKPSAEELARFLDLLKTSPPLDKGTVPAPLAKTAAVLPTCRVTFNNSTSLGTLQDQANMGYAIRGYYHQPCNTSYTVSSAPVNGVAYRLIPENSSWCPGKSPNIGFRNSAGDCVYETQGKYWPRRLGNDANSDGVSFNAANSTHYRDFDLKSLYVHSGKVDVWGYTPAGDWLFWGGLYAANTWFFPPGSTVAQLRIFESGGDARFLVDNLEVAIHP